ncbi:hypothetical protein [Treponema endosymbiont of Eucomonympha sp.]|uniref:hypothetical protein n=1 Tax=Treponema endosymbiont of Eucomonympha sp. TaxID=1580831 RepID=UPI0007827B19|nr:hypothetical protein [Treponema endosymbiont of Eucomonympha sp.]
MFSAPFPKTVPRRTPPPRIFALCLAASAALFVGCKNNVNDNSFADSHELNAKLIGEWKFEYEGGYELYAITTTTFVYGGASGEAGYSETFSGTIEYASNFSDNGVIIVQSDNLPDYFGESGNQYLGIYYRDLTAKTVKIANPTDLNHTDGYGPTATDTLDGAKAKFTVDAAVDFVNWSMVQSQTKQ